MLQEQRLTVKNMQVLKMALSSDEAIGLFALQKMHMILKTEKIFYLASYS